MIIFQEFIHIYGNNILQTFLLVRTLCTSQVALHFEVLRGKELWLC